MNPAKDFDPRDAKVLNDAVSQFDRLRAAPAPGKVPVDGRSLAQLLAFGARYGALIRFYDLSDMEDGDWSIFFAADPAIALAVRGALDLPEIEMELRLALAKARAAAGHEHHREHVHRAKRVIVRLVFILDASFPDGDEVDVQLTMLATAGRRDGIGGPLRDWHRHHRHPSSPEDHGWHNRHLDLLEDVTAALIAELERNAAAALAGIDQSLTSRGHPPQTALWNAFVTLFDEARAEMNRFPQRLLDFYYRTILRQWHRAARPDEVFLTFMPTQGVDEASIPKGTLFQGGADAKGEPINFATTSSLSVEAATVTGVSVHRISYAQGSMIDNEVPIGVLSGTVSLPPSGGDVAPFPLFGGDGRGMFGALTMAPATLGFVVESPALLLSGGERKVKISLMTAYSSAPSAPSIPPPGHAAPLGVQTSLQDAVTETPLTSEMTLAFRLVYSTAGGWVNVDDLLVTTTYAAGRIPACIVFSFTLPATAPPLVPVSAKPQPGAPKPALPATAYPDLVDQPALVANLLYEPLTASEAAGDTPVPVSVYALLSTMKIASIAIDVSVDDFVPPMLSGPNGQIDPHQNFPVFGLVPTQHAALEFSAPEFFVKQVNHLSTTIIWAGLPVNSTGFQGYYQGYRLDVDGVASARPMFDNATFRATFGLVSPGPWTLDPASQLYLFQTDGSSTAAEGAPPASATAVSQSSLLAIPGMKPNTPPPYYNPAASAVRLSLAAPGYAFGNILYANNLRAASLANAAAVHSAAANDKTPIAAVSAVNATAPAKQYGSHVGEAVSQAISGLNGKAMAALQNALADNGGNPAIPVEAFENLQAAIQQVSGKWSLWAWLKSNVSPADAAIATTGLRAWLTTYGGDLVATAAPNLALAHAALSAAEMLAAEWPQISGKPAAVARPMLAATLERTQSIANAPLDPAAASQAASLPNPPWLPMASSLTVSYTAAGDIAFTPNTETAAPEPAASGGIPQGRFLHLGLFDDILPAPAMPPLPAVQAIAPSAAPSAAGAHALPKVHGRAAFYIDLSAPVTQISLLFILTAGPDGWSSGPSTVTWLKRVGDHWAPITTVSDGTNGLRNSGVIVLQIASLEEDDSEGAQSLCAMLADGEVNNAYVTSITTNAVVATWAGPGGADTLGQPLPPGTIKQSQAPLAGIGSIAQPMQSIGGAPPSIGAPFQMWMAERLRHKGFAINAWDYARLVLDAIPSLWQLAVVPATDERTGLAAPGQVWLVAVAGPQTPNVDDPTIPAVVPGILAEIGELLAGVVSPFARLTITNPPYLRLTVQATLVFSEANTPGFWIEKLEADLIKWLSPWPDPEIRPRPVDYYTRQAIAEFIRQRSYVQAIKSLRIVAETDPAPGGWYYLTSALSHQLKCSTSVQAGTPRHLDALSAIGVA